MSKVLKEMVTDHLKLRYDGVDSACVVDVTRMDVAAVVQFRRALRDQGARVEVVKNSLARRAFRGGPLAPLGESLEGSCALVTGGSSVIEVAKALVTLKGKFEKLELKKAVLHGDAGLLTVEQLSKMKGRIELLNELAGLIAATGRRLAGAIRSPGAKIAGCLKARAEGGETAAA